MSKKYGQILWPLLGAALLLLAWLFVIWFGFGLLPKVLAVILVCFFPIVISMLSGLAARDQLKIGAYSRNADRQAG